MAKLFKNTKSALSFVLAFAVLAVSLFTGVVINSEAAACDPDGSVVIYGGGAGVAPTLLDPSAANSESNPYIIKTAENLLYIVKEGVASTAGNYYKVADNVKAFVMQPKDRFNAKGATVEDLMNLDAAGVMEWFDDPNKTVSITSENKLGSLNCNWTINGTSVKWQNWNKSGTAFQGTFDGNGVTVYGVVNQGNTVGLFGNINGATIKNVNVKGSYGVGYEGGMFGKSTGGNNVIENCTVSDSVLISCRARGSTSQTAAGGDSYTSVGFLAGSLNNSTSSTIKNCMVSDVIGYNFIYDRGDGKTEAETVGATLTDTYDYAANGNTLSMFGSFNNADTSVVTGCIALGVYPHVSPKGNWNNNGGRPASFSNCYTDKPTTAANGLAFANKNDISYSAAQIKQIDPANLIGEGAIATCSALDWNNTWFAVKDGMPVLRAFHNISSVGHTEKCEDCGIEGAVATPHRYVGNTCTICGKVLACGEEVIYWDGTTDSNLADNGEAGTAKDPIIIDSAAELHQLAINSTYASTNGKYYKVADGIGTIVLQSDSHSAILGLADAAAVKTYFAGGADLQQWAKGIGYKDKEFCGNFDGNGVEIYGMYQTAADNTNGLFPLSDAGAVFKNFALKNSYVANTSINFSGAFVIGKTPGAGIGANADGIIAVENVAVINNYMNRTTNNHNHIGVLTGEFTDTALVKNCLIYGNDATYTYNEATYNVPMAGAANGGMGYQDYMTDMGIAQNGIYACYTVKNSIVLGTAPYNPNNPSWRFGAPHCYSGVYADTMPTLTIISNGQSLVQTFAEDQVKDITGLTGAELAKACKALDWDNIWLATTGTPELRVFHDKTFTAVDNGDGTHTVTCSCGLAVATEGHTFVDGECEDCGYVCIHGTAVDLWDWAEFVQTSPATCTEAEIGNYVCSVCGAVLLENEEGETGALGHNIKLVPGTPAKCTEDGVKDYYACSRCDAVFEDAAGTTPIDNLDIWKVIPAAGHTETKDSQNKTVYAWDSAQPGMHFKVCSVCREKYDGENCTGEYVADGANGHSGRCTVCGMQTAGVAPHNFDENGSCTTCHWTCTAHNFVDAGPGTPATCVTAGAVPTKCSICGKVGTDRVVDATGHNLEAFEACEGTCSWEGYIAHKYCYKCEKNFAADETDIYSTDYLTEEDISTPIVPENHNWVEVEAKVADHDNGGNVAYKYCDICGMLSMGDDEVDLGIDVEAISNSIQDEVDAAWDEHEAKRDEYDSDEEFNEAWDEKYDAIFHAAFNKAVLAAASANGVTLVTPAKGHTIVKVDEVPATTEKEGTKAHWICTDCGKLYSDAEGTTEVTLEQLVIAKLPATPAESTNTNTDNSNKAPATGETVATAVAAVAAVIAAGFVLVRKSRKA